MLACVVVMDYTAQVEQWYVPTRAPLLFVTGVRPVVMAVDAQAGNEGVRRGMPLKRAQALCPEAEVRPLIESRLRVHFEAVLELVSGFANRYEVQPPKEGADPVLWLDMGSSADIPARIWQLRSGLYEQLHLHTSAGIAQGKFPAFVATLKGGVKTVQAGHERAFLAPMPVDLLPLTAGERRQLDLCGLRTLGLLAALPRAAVLAQFGQHGRLLHQLACGEDPRPLIPYQPPPVERLSRRFSDMLADESQLDRAVQELATEASARLRGKGASCGQLTLCLGYERGGAHEQSQTLRVPLVAERDLLHALRRLCTILPRSEVVALDLELGALAAEQPQQLRLFEEPAAQHRTPRQAAAAQRARHRTTAFEQAGVPEQAEWIPETVVFAPLEDP